MTAGLLEVDDVTAGAAGSKVQKQEYVVVEATSAVTQGVALSSVMPAAADREDATVPSV